MLRNNKTEERKELPVSAVFIAIGHIPNTGLFKEYLELDAGGYIVTDKKHSTNIEGIYAAGDVQDPFIQAGYYFGRGRAAAAIEASRYIDNYQG